MNVMFNIRNVCYIFNNHNSSKILVCNIGCCGLKLSICCYAFEWLYISYRYTLADSLALAPSATPW